MNRLTRDGTTEPVSRGQIPRHERGQEKIHFPCSGDHVQDWQPYPVDPYSCYSDHTTLVKEFDVLQYYKKNIRENIFYAACQSRVLRISNEFLIRKLYFKYMEYSSTQQSSTLDGTNTT